MIFHLFPLRDAKAKEEKARPAAEQNRIVAKNVCHIAEKCPLKCSWIIVWRHVGQGSVWALWEGIEETAIRYPVSAVGPTGSQELGDQRLL